MPDHGPDLVPFIDTHVHCWDADTKLSPDRSYTPRGYLPVEALLSMMDAHDVAGAVLVQPQFLGTDNGYLLQALRRYPDRLRGVAVVTRDAPLQDLQDLRGAGVAGIRLNLTHGDQPDLAGDDWRRFLERVNAAGLHVQLHADAERLVTLLPDILDAGSRVVVDHFGRPEPDGGAACESWLRGIGLLEAGDHVVKLSAPYRLRGVAAVPVAETLIGTLGAERLVWGSDCPWTRFEAGRSYQACIDWLSDWVPCPRDRAAIGYRNAVALYGFEM